jgi:uncharacterized protein YjiS (DUF1127 family)
MTATFAAFFAPAVQVAARPRRPLARRLLEALLALDAGHRNARKLASASDDRLADMGITRAEAEGQYRRHLGDAALRRPHFPGW